MVRDQVPYQELGPASFDHLQTQRLERHSVQRLEALGFQVTLTPASSPISRTVWFSSPSHRAWGREAVVFFRAWPADEFSGEMPSHYSKRSALKNWRGVLTSHSEES